MSLPAVLILSSPDDYLLELERRDAEHVWRTACPQGEVTAYETAPSALRLIEGLSNRSLFASERLFLVRDARPYLSEKAGEKPAPNKEGEALAEVLAELPLEGITLVLVAVSAAEPKGALAGVVKRRGELRFLPLPEAPKPWQDVRITPAQRQVLEEKVIRRVAPALLDEGDVLDVLFDIYGFRPRELAQAAERLVLSGDVSPAAVRDQAGVGERSLRELEEALLRHDPARLSRFIGALTAGGVLTGWFGESIAPDRLTTVLAGTVGRLLRQAVGVRGLAVKAGLARELVSKRCDGRDWYRFTFKSKIFPRIEEEIANTPAAPLTGTSAWAMHRAFRLAATYPEADLLAALGRLGASGAERSRGGTALAAVSAVLFDLLTANAE